LLNKAASQIENNQYSSPKHNNAYETYNKILKLEPGNKQAIDGITNIQGHYKTLFEKYIAASNLHKADSVISIMKNISAPSSSIKQMQKTLEVSQQKSSTASANTSASRRLDINQASKLVGEFQSAIQQHNKIKLNTMSQYAPGREQFVSQLMAQYLKINVRISNLRLISKDNEVKAHVELTDLVDKNNNNILPGSWSKFEIVVRENNKKQLKIYW
jgi:hypothetical protein